MRVWSFSLTPPPYPSVSQSFLKGFTYSEIFRRFTLTLPRTRILWTPLKPKGQSDLWPIDKRFFDVGRDNKKTLGGQGVW